MQISARHVVLYAALGAAVCKAAEGHALHSGAPGMDLVAGQHCPRQLRRGDGGGILCAVLCVRKHSLDGQQPQPAHGLAASALSALGVGKGLTQHLVAAAYAQHWRAGGCQFLHRSFQPALTQPEQVIYGVFCARQNDHVRRAQLPGALHIPHAQQRVLFQRHKICKIGDVRQPQNGSIQRLDGGAAFQPGGEGVLVLNIHPQVGHNAQHRQMGLFLQHGKAGFQDGGIAPELIDDQPLDACPLGGLQQLYRAVQLRKHAAPVDISRQQHRCIHQLCQPHIDDIVRF